MIKSKPKPITNWFVYILRCGDGNLYAGITTDPKRRLQEHNAGTASRYTRARLPVRLAYKEKAKSRSTALKREVEIKSWPRHKKIELIKKKNRS